MTNTDSGVKVSERPFNDLVEMNACGVIISKERVLSEYCLDTVRLSSHEYHVLKYTSTLMTMDYVDVFTYQDLSYQW